MSRSKTACDQRSETVHLPELHRYTPISGVHSQCQLWNGSPRPRTLPHLWRSSLSTCYAPLPQGMRKHSGGAHRNGVEIAYRHTFAQWLQMHACGDKQCTSGRPKLRGASGVHRWTVSITLYRSRSVVYCNYNGPLIARTNRFGPWISRIAAHLLCIMHVCVCGHCLIAVEDKRCWNCWKFHSAVSSQSGSVQSWFRPSVRNDVSKDLPLIRKSAIYSTVFIYLFIYYYFYFFFMYTYSCTNSIIINHATHATNLLTIYC